MAINSSKKATGGDRVTSMSGSRRQAWCCAAVSEENLVGGLCVLSVLSGHVLLAAETLAAQRYYRWGTRYASRISAMTAGSRPQRSGHCTASSSIRFNFMGLVISADQA